MSDGLTDEVGTESVIRNALHDVGFWQPPGFAAIGLREFLLREIPPRDMLLDPIISTQDLTMIFAKAGVGKTHVALGISYAVATGGTFLRWQAPKARRVLYVDGEMAAGAMQQRIAAMIAGGGVEPDPEYLRIITPDLQERPTPNLPARRRKRFFWISWTATPMS
jgi:hypothetical protein